MKAEVRYRLYVIELGKHPGGANGRTVYVGHTGKTVSDRFRDHMAGGVTSSRRVRRYGTRLLPGLVRGLPTFATRTEAEEAEVLLVTNLRSQGYRVFGGSGRRVLEEFDSD